MRALHQRESGRQPQHAAHLARPQIAQRVAQLGAQLGERHWADEATLDWPTDLSDCVRAIASKLEPAWISASSDSARSAELTTISRNVICGSAGVCACDQRERAHHREQPSPLIPDLCARTDMYR